MAVEVRSPAIECIAGACAGEIAADVDAVELVLPYYFCRRVPVDRISRAELATEILAPAIGVAVDGQSAGMIDAGTHHGPLERTVDGGWTMSFGGCSVTKFAKKVISPAVYFLLRDAAGMFAGRTHARPFEVA